MAQPLVSVDAVFHALGDGTRRRIFERVARGPASVGELADGLPVSRAAVSQHLRALTESGLVESQPSGTKRIYRLQARGVTAMRKWLDTIWDDALHAFAQEIARENQARQQTDNQPGEDPK